MRYIIKIFIFIAIQFFASTLLYAQKEIVLDEIIAVIGDEIVTKRDLEAKFSDMVSQGMSVTDNSRCEVFEDLLFSTMLLNQSRVDSIEVTEQQLEAEMNQRLSYYINQIGSADALEKYYKKPISQIKDEMRKVLREQMLIQQMQGKITAAVRITPSEVEAYYNSIPKDSLPLIDAEVEVAHIVKYATVSKKSIDEAKEKLNKYKERVNSGEQFSTLAVLYSDDQGSAVKGGEIGFVGRAEVEAEFAAAAFQLKEGEVSPIVETNFGYHIIQLIERRGAKVNVRHILIKPKLTAEAMQKAKNELDSIANLIAQDSISFAKAANLFSDDDDTKKNGGIIVNPQTGSSMTPMDKLEPSLFFVIDKLNDGDVSEAVQIQNPRKKPGYRIIKILKRTDPHYANLQDDYQKVKQAASGEKERELLQEWMGRTIRNTYISLDEKYSKDCKFMQDWSVNKSN